MVELGYDCIIEIVYPHMTNSAKREVHASYEVVGRLSSPVSGDSQGRGYAQIEPFHK